MKSICVQLAAVLFVTQAALGQLGTVYAVVSGDSVTIGNPGIQANCAARFVFDAIVFQDSLRIVERDTSTRLATCTCGFDLSVTVAHLQPGTYIARVYRSHVAPSYRIYYVGSANFVILSSAGGQSIYRGVQSDCHPDAVGSGPSPIPEFSLNQNYPNPFNPATKITYGVPERSDVRLSVFNILGQEVMRLVNGQMEAGTYTVALDASQLSSGVYLYELQAGAYRATKRMVLMK